MRSAIGLIAAFLLILMLAPAHAAEPTRVPCWQVKAFLASHADDKRAARQAARARGYAEADIAEAERRCFR